MTAAGFALVLTAAVCHAVWNFFVKRINAGPELVWMFSALSSLIYLPAAIWFASGLETVTPMQLVFVAGSAAFHVAYFLLLQLGYRKGELSLVYPTARATGPLLATTFAVLILGEAISLQAVLGGALIVFGVLMLTRGARKGGGQGAWVSVGFGLTVGVLISGYTIWDAHAVSALAIPPLLLDYGSGLTRVVVLAPLAARRVASMRAIWAAHWPRVLAIAVFNVLAYVLVLYALTFTPVIYVAPLREMSVVLTVLMGSLLLGEGHLRQRLTWACVILLGVATLATARI